MRALCESCSRPQPVDWRPGDLCAWCGQAARREVRCFWCAKWTPAAKFCRTCGAAVVEPELYGAARMLKDAGTDRFSVPRQLREFDAEQIENFTRIYQEHAVVAAHHVAQTAFLEQYLEQRHWSAALDDTLAAELPWSIERFEKMRSAARRVPEHLEGLDRARAIGESTPFRETWALATLARLALEDWTACNEAAQCLVTTDETILWEAALALSHWRVLRGPGSPADRRQLLDALRRCPLKEPAALRLALLGEPGGGPLPPEDFGAALVTGDVARLSTAAHEGDPLMQFAAAQRLIELDAAAPAAGVLRSATPDRQLALLRLLERRKRPVPELKEALFEVAANAQERQVVDGACTVLCVGCDAGDALPIARAGRGDPAVYQALLQRAAMPAPVLEQFGEFLIAEGAFRASQWGMKDVAREGRMPAGFVARHWQNAGIETRVELCRFAEMQLGEYGDEELHRFLGMAALTPSDVKVQSEAWSCLYRWYDSFGFPRRRPLAISPAAIQFFFGSPGRFLAGFERFLEGREILRESLQRDRIANLLGDPDSAALPWFVELPAETLAVAGALAGVMRDGEIDLMIRLACADLLGFLGSAAAFRGPVTVLLRTFQGTDMDLQSSRALERISQAAG